jgi:hypothetical protein
MVFYITAFIRASKTPCSVSVCSQVSSSIMISTTSGNCKQYNLNSSTIDQSSVSGICVPEVSVESHNMYTEKAPSSGYYNSKRMAAVSVKIGLISRNFLYTDLQKGCCQGLVYDALVFTIHRSSSERQTAYSLSISSFTPDSESLLARSTR